MSILTQPEISQFKHTVVQHINQQLNEEKQRQSMANRSSSLAQGTAPVTFVTTTAFAVAHTNEPPRM